MKRALTALLLAVSLLTVPVSAFSDVDEGLYYAAPIAWAVEKGITTGTTENTFSPDALCTQGQILTFLWRAAGSPAVETEVLESSSPLNPDFAKAIGWGVEAGILSSSASPAISAGAVLFNPYAPCTRADAMGFLWRFAGSPTAGAPAAFTDVAPEASYAQAVAWAVEQGITSGTSEATFSPGEPCTRGQIATFLYRCLNESAPEEVPVPEEPAPSANPAQDSEEEARPLRTLTGQGKAYSLGLDGSEFTSDEVYTADVTVDIYSPQEAVFSVKVPFPLYQACSYVVRFDDPEKPGDGYMFTFLRWDEAFADIIPWEGARASARFTDMSGEQATYAISCEHGDDERIDGLLVRRVSFSKDSYFNFNLLDGHELSCEVSSNL